jgi:hypothetical protein
MLLTSEIDETGWGKGREGEVRRSWSEGIGFFVWIADNPAQGLH